MWCQKRNLYTHIYSNQNIDIGLHNSLRCPKAEPVYCIIFINLSKLWNQEAYNYLRIKFFIMQS